MDQRISLITLGVDDLARARRFYEEGLGWTPHRKSEGDIVFYQLPGIALALYPRAALLDDATLPSDTPRGAVLSIAINARSKEEVDAIFAEVAAADARIVKPPEDVFWGGYSGYFSDPDGHLWEVAWNPGFAIAKDGTISLDSPE
ncbi:MAG TPA: glyoxalase [Chloroflexi bacterium]|nr:glyoxalase [Chloroflexota bacterium]HRA32837.1 VOC family protein [Thermomicrobiales bacterium]